MLAGARPGIGVKRRINLCHQRGDVTLGHSFRKNLVVTALAEPNKGFVFFQPALALDHQSPGVFAAPRRMRHIAGTDKDFALANFHDLPAFVARLEVKLDIAFDLIEEFLAGFHVKIETAIRPAQNHHDELVVVNEHAVSLRGGRKKMLIFLDPAFKMKSGKEVHKTTTGALEYSATPFFCTRARLRPLPPTRFQSLCEKLSAL